MDLANSVVEYVLIYGLVVVLVERESEHDWLCIWVCAYVAEGLKVVK
jgi:hypothetical protein